MNQRVKSSMKDKKRSSKQKITTASSIIKGVGGRQHRSPPVTQGGGDLDVCNNIEQLLCDPSLRDLSHSGIPDIWIRIANHVGFDFFIFIWDLFDRHLTDSCGSRRDRPRIPLLPRFNRYHLYIRSLFIDKGFKANALKKIIKQDLDVDLGVRQINRIIEKVR